jgi:hypothetical protein
MVMMYISVFPIAISVRRTNVYEEKSLGIYPSDADDQGNSNGQSDLSYVGSHLRRQLSFDLWYIVLGFFILCIVEGPKIMDGKFTQFAILFEVVSAYGTVGMSLGYPGVNASLCSQFTVVGKLVLVAMMIRGRHRGLPYGLDRAILLPSETLNAHEGADDSERLSRRISHASAPPGIGIPITGRSYSFSTRGGRSISRDRGNSIFTSLLHPGPPMPPIHHLDPRIRSEMDLNLPTRRSTEPIAPHMNREDDLAAEGVPPEMSDPNLLAPETSRVTRISSRRTEPGVTRRWISPMLKRTQSSALPV